MNLRVLMLVTSHDRLGDSGHPTGVWAEELAVPYYAFTDAGCHVDLASPEGGPVPFDPRSLETADGPLPAAVERLQADEALREKLRQSWRAAAIDMHVFDALFVPGGHGAMWDLATDPAVAHLVETAFASGRIVAALCHGPAALVSAKGPDGRFLLEGKHVNSFTDAEEDALGLGDTVPFLLENRLRELGAFFEGGPNWQPYAVRDANLITGQNPQSSALVAQQVLDALRAGLESASRTWCRVRPWFEPGPWGGQWMKRRFPGLSPEAPNLAWSSAV